MLELKNQEKQTKLSKVLQETGNIALPQTSAENGWWASQKFKLLQTTKEVFKLSEKADMVIEQARVEEAVMEVRSFKL